MGGGENGGGKYFVDYYSELAGKYVRVVGLHTQLDQAPK